MCQTIKKLINFSPNWLTIIKRDLKLYNAISCYMIAMLALYYHIPGKLIHNNGRLIDFINSSSFLLLLLIKYISILYLV